MRDNIEEMGQVERYESSCNYNIKNGLKEMHYDGDQIFLACDSDEWMPLVNILMDFRVV
jgi:hypothetical protein